MLKISRLDINLPADLVQTCAGVRESQLCKFIATNSQGEFQHSIEVRGKQNNVISLELSNLSISFQDGHFVAEVEQALKVFQGRSETENEAVIPDAHVTSSQNAELESSHSDSGQPPDQVTPQDHYVSQVPMATNVTQGHQPTPEPSPRRLFRNISRKRPAETVTSGAMKFPRIIQEERLPSLTSGTTTTALTQQTHSDTKQTEEVSVEESRHDIVEVKVETDDDDYEDLTGAIDDNTGDSANKPSSSYVHSVPMVSQALASQHVVLGHSSSSTGHHTGQHTAVQHSGQAIARRQEQVKMTPETSSDNSTRAAPYSRYNAETPTFHHDPDEDGEKQWKIASTCSSNVPFIPVSPNDLDSDLKKSKKREFKESWRAKFGWIQYDSQREMMFCTLCQKHNKINAFTKGCTTIKKDNASKHELISDHKEAVSQESQCT
ncbi:uncharacterized protein LOC106156073 isoform X3 [Lingula anatina]|uniref:Uncharacterized protein LOC106156073 isoform X3 n=1 Tax=Lingula anatina TaxID=7574 RepID=A0A1S3HMC3_LINAN|nr:uncharacterized protein LOC106156073 isoform X3 [Lingula anatina]|eukprot:XP_013386636.1 uncharacterized protein LOC106156073 isoform X3 [Lingula anatina]